MGKEVYVAYYEELGAKACRILVPGYSEIYPSEDLIWDNTNKSLYFRDDILNLHSLDDDELTDLVERLEESQLDNYTRISELIGIEFDENSVWGQLDIGELKALSYLALSRFEDAKEQVSRFLAFNDNSNERKLFYQALDAVLDIKINDDLILEDYLKNLERMFGKSILEQVLSSADGSARFYGLHELTEELHGLDKHQRMIESYQKLMQARTKS